MNAQQQTSFKIQLEKDQERKMFDFVDLWFDINSEFVLHWDATNSYGNQSRFSTMRQNLQRVICEANELLKMVESSPHRENLLRHLHLGIKVFKRMNSRENLYDMYPDVKKQIQNFARAQ